MEMHGCENAQHRISKSFQGLVEIAEMFPEKDLQAAESQISQAFDQAT